MMQPRTLYSLCLLALALMGLTAIVVLETVRPEFDRGLLVQIIGFMGTIAGVFIFLLRQEKKADEKTEEIKRDVHQTVSSHQEAMEAKMDANTALTKEAADAAKQAAFNAQAAARAAQSGT